MSIVDQAVSSDACNSSYREGVLVRGVGESLIAQAAVSNCLNKYYPTLREDYIFEYLISSPAYLLTYDKIMFTCVRRVHYFLRENLRDDDDVELLIERYLNGDEMHWQERAVAKFTLFLEEIQTDIVEHYRQKA